MYLGHPGACKANGAQCRTHLEQPRKLLGMSRAGHRSHHQTSSRMILDPPPARRHRYPDRGKVGEYLRPRRVLHSEGIGLHAVAAHLSCHPGADRDVVPRGREERPETCRRWRLVLGGHSGAEIDPAVVRRTEPVHLGKDCVSLLEPELERAHTPSYHRLVGASRAATVTADEADLKGGSRRSGRQS